MTSSKIMHIFFIDTFIWATFKNLSKVCSNLQVPVIISNLSFRVSAKFQVRHSPTFPDYFLLFSEFQSTFALISILLRVQCLTLPRFGGGVKRTPSTTYLHTKSKLCMLKRSNSQNFLDFNIVFRKKYFYKFGQTATPIRTSSFLIVWSVTYKVTQIL